MQNKIFILLLILLISNDLVFGKNGNKTKTEKNNKKHDKIHSNGKNRLRRSLNVEIDKTLLPGRTQYDHNLEGRGRIKLQQIVEKELPFWGTRGRRESGSDETVPDVQLPTYSHHKNAGKIKSLHKLLMNLDETQSNDEVDSPFWGNRGRRTSDESNENDIDVFWGNRGRRQEDEPFWGTRGRREEDSPFWGNRGRRDDDDEPFWGNRGRRDETEPFWSNRGKIKFGPNLSKSKTECSNNDVVQLYWKNRAKLKSIKHSMLRAMENFRDNIDTMNIKKRNDDQSSYWINRGRDSKLKYLFNSAVRNRFQYIPASVNKPRYDDTKRLEPSTVHDDRIYAEEPRYILVERSSRSSAEDDPFFITRGKKFSDLDIAKATRGRRGAIEDIFKSVRNDPYYIARGKKQSNDIKSGNSNLKQDQLFKTKELVCSTVDLMMLKGDGNRSKKEKNDSERDRRTILNKLARQLQMDPYIVSRGKKNDESNGQVDSLEQFLNNVISLCN